MKKLENKRVDLKSNLTDTFAKYQQIKYTN